MKKYKKELATNSDTDDTSELPAAKQGRPLLLGEELDSQMMEHIEAIHEASGVINRPILIATATGIVKHHDHSLLAEHGGNIELGRVWSNGI